MRAPLERRDHEVEGLEELEVLEDPADGPNDKYYCYCYYYYVLLLLRNTFSYGGAWDPDDPGRRDGGHPLTLGACASYVCPPPARI